jgi:hypothetical protein
MRRLCFEVVLLGMAAAAHAAQPGNAVVAPGFNLLEVQTVQFDADGLPRISRYRFSATIVPIHAIDTTPFGSAFSSTYRLAPAAEGQKEVAWASNSDLIRFLGGDRTMLSPRLRIESAGQRLEIVPRRHSVWIQWRQELR